MRRAIVILNGEIKHNAKIYKKYLNKNYKIYCADGGANHAYKFGIIPEMIIGDLDSIDKKIKKYYLRYNTKFEKYPIEKDFTDGELIINKIYNLYDEIIIFGATGGRTDHFLSNIFLIEKYPKIKFISWKEEIFLIEKNTHIFNRKNKEISFVALDKKIKKITLSGFKYPLTDYTLHRGSSITMSNIILSNEVKVELKEGRMLAIINL